MSELDKQFWPEPSDYRAEWVNQTLQLIYDKHESAIMTPEALREIGIFYEGAQHFVRNIYEVINEQIPMFALYELKVKHGFDKFMFDEDVTEADWEHCILSACQKYHGK